MYRFIKKYNKRLFAIFAAFLMVAFVAGYGLTPSGPSSDVVVGTIGEADEKVYAEDLRTAEAEWQLLMRERGFQTQLGALPVAFLLGWNEMSAMQLMQGRAPMPVEAINENPRLFYLLREEAERMGVTVSNDQVQEIVVNATEQRPRPADEQRFLEQSIHDLLLVNAAFQRAASVIKVSQPMKRFEQARQQSMSVNLVEFNASDFADQVPPPTTQQLQKQFATYADVVPGDAGASPESPGSPTTNPFGFGYRFPDRVKLQYIAIPRSEVRKSINQSRGDYEWEVAARKYYQQHQDEFPTTRPAGDFDPAASTQPTTRPFEEVKDEAKNRVLLPEVDKKISEIQSLIVASLNADYQALLKANDGKTPTTAATQSAPASSLGVPYTSYEYLEKLADRIQSQTGIRPTIVSMTDQWRDAEALSTLPGIGSSATSDGTPFAQYVMAAAEPLVPETQRRDETNVLRLWEPSTVLREAGGSALGDIYIARLTEAQPEQAPKSLEQVRDAVVKDVIAAEQLARAREAAGKLLDAAKQSGLTAAATQAGKTLISTGSFDGQGMEVPGYSLSAEARTAFVEEAFKLLSTPAPREGAQPVAILELPQTGKIIVAELKDVRQEWTEDQVPLRLAAMTYQIRDQLTRIFEFEWFNYDQARKRVGFESDLDRDDSENSEDAALL